MSWTFITVTFIQDVYIFKKYSTQRQLLKTGRLLKTQEQVFHYAKHFCFQWRKTKEDNDAKVGIFYAELLTRKVILWVFIFSSETSERKNPPFNIWNQNLRLRHNFFNWKSNQYETYYIFTQNLEKISTSHVMGSCA